MLIWEDQMLLWLNLHLWRIFYVILLLGRNFREVTVLPLVPEALLSSQGSPHAVGFRQGETTTYSPGKQSHTQLTASALSSAEQTLFPLLCSFHSNPLYISSLPGFPLLWDVFCNNTQAAFQKHLQEKTQTCSICCPCSLSGTVFFSSCFLIRGSGTAMGGKQTLQCLQRPWPVEDVSFIALSGTSRTQGNFAAEKSASEFRG